jgi:hypothetical protein
MTNGVWIGVALWFGLSAGFVAWGLHVTRLVGTIVAPVKTRPGPR